MKFRARVEPPEPMRGLEVPQEVAEALGGGKRPAVTITINEHSWRSRVAIMRGSRRPSQGCGTPGRAGAAVALRLSLAPGLACTVRTSSAAEGKPGRGPPMRRRQAPTANEPCVGRSRDMLRGGVGLSGRPRAVSGRLDR
jgi:hypothetical protein